MYTVYSFSPSSTGTYYFTINGGYKYSVLFDSDGYRLATDSGSEVEIAYECKRGKTYYIGTRQSILLTQENPVRLK